MTVFINNIAVQTASDETLKKWRKDGLQLTVTESDIHIEFTPTKSAHALPQNDFNITVEKDKAGQLKTKTAVEFGDLTTLSVDQDGHMEAGLHLKF